MITVKILLLFSKKINYFEIIICAVVYNLFSSVFVKKVYIRDEILGFEIKDKRLKRLNLFKTFLNYSIIGYILNSILFLYMYNKLEFYFLDDGKLL